MKCPLITTEVRDGTKRIADVPAQCRGDECVWYNVHEARCAVVSLSDSQAKLLASYEAMK